MTTESQSIDLCALPSEELLKFAKIGLVYKERVQKSSRKRYETFKVPMSLKRKIRTQEARIRKAHGRVEELKALYADAKEAMNNEKPVKIATAEKSGDEEEEKLLNLLA